MNSAPFTESMRYDYPDMTADSVVLDCGGFEGTFAEGISQRYDCTVHVLEPVRAFYERTRERLKDRPKVRVWPFGIWHWTTMLPMKVCGDVTGAYRQEGQDESVLVLRAVDLGRSLARKVDSTLHLLKLNIEGAEFDVLESLLDHGAVWRYENIQVQWHDVAPNAEARRDKIIERLSVSHELTFDHGWVWQSWRARK
jgi:FkbM family methyltransferase